ncbi:MAG TPA: hydroxymyristoyl-ACP dehydratase, partial [Burkholderiaceae bacterium]|nr:hydroxymyristoyl-ACP dehydratase [Burkholderiaceae bacterium]
MRLTHEQIAALIPHSGPMCLLDEVLSADHATLRCHARSHLDPRHPMRGPDGLGAACAIEYAAQAMALHDALRHRAAAVPPAAGASYGMLVSLRDVRFAVRRLDLVCDPLLVQVELLSGDGAGALYAFQVGTATRELVCGRASVIPEAGPRLPVRPLR